MRARARQEQRCRRTNVVPLQQQAGSGIGKLVFGDASSLEEEEEEEGDRELGGGMAAEEEGGGWREMGNQILLCRQHLTS